MSEPAPNARDVAVRALRDREGNVSAHLKRQLTEAGLSSQDKALASELSLGVVRRRGTLAAVLNAYLERPGQRLPPPIPEILHVALYQMLMLERVPAFAAVDEAVRQADRFQHKRKAGLVNGILRNVGRGLSDVREGTLPVTRDAVPIRHGVYRTFDRPVLPNPDADAAGYIAAAYSLPYELAGRWLRNFGGMEGVAPLAMHACCRPPLILRVNRVKTTVAGLLAKFSEANIRAAAHENGLSIVVLDHLAVTDLPGFSDGLFQPQDPSATAVGIAADPRAGASVLDFCAAPGTKTTHLVELMGNRGMVTAVDVSADKLRRIEANCARMGVTIVKTMLAERVASLPSGGFELALADVPCSGTGVLARRVEARWRFHEDRLPAMTHDQQTLAAMAAEFVRPGGRLVYSTCSIEPEECGEVAWRLCRRRNLKLLWEKQTMPAGADDPVRWTDGGYVAIFQVR